jgi:uncharacterized protein (DUF983 family)
MNEPLSLVAIALKCRCPRCGRGKLYAGVLEVAARCPECGLELAAQDAADGPAVFVVFILGAIVVPLAFLVEVLFAPPLWIHIVLWTPVILGGAIALLRPLKAALIALEYRHRALGGGPAE